MTDNKAALLGFLKSLRRVRVKAGLTQDQVVAALGFQGKARKTVVSRLERGG